MKVEYLRENHESEKEKRLADSINEKFNSLTTENTNMKNQYQELMNQKKIYSGKNLPSIELGNSFIPKKTFTQNQSDFVNVTPKYFDIDTYYLYREDNIHKGKITSIILTQNGYISGSEDHNVVVKSINMESNPIILSQSNGTILSLDIKFNAFNRFI